MWLLKNDAVTREELLVDSSSIGKYSGGNNSILNSKLINGLWGIAGNLEEITQERLESGKVVLRGGSYSMLGSEIPLAGRGYLNCEKNDEVIKEDSVGFRNCLYIKTSEDKSGTSTSTNTTIGKVTGVEVTSTSNKGEVKIVWNKVNNVDGYQIYIEGLSNTNSIVKQNFYESVDVTEIIIKGLYEGKYKITVRAYKNVNDEKVYGELSEEVIFELK